MACIGIFCMIRSFRTAWMRHALAVFFILASQTRPKPQTRCPKLKISFGKWSTNTVLHNVTSQSLSFPSDNTLSPSFKSNFNTLNTGDISVNFSTSLTTSTTTYDENTKPLERGNASRGTREVFCTWCNTYINHGRERHTMSTLFKHQKGQKCRLKLIGVL